MPFRSSAGSTQVRDLGVLRLTDEDGRTGLGEITPYPDPDAASLEELVAAFDELARPSLIGDGLTPTGESLPFELPTQVASAIDVARLDLLARRQDLRVAELIGTEIQQRVPVNATVTALDPDEVAGHAEEAVAAGFSTIKLKVGFGKHDAQRLAALREAVGFQPLVRLDANGAWFTAEAIEQIAELQEYGLELVEQPVAPDDISSMQRVRDAAMVPVVADEGVRRAEDLELHIANGACDGVAIKLAQVGGITPAAKLAATAARAGLLKFVTSTLDGPIGLAAGLHFAAAHSDFSLANGLATGRLFTENYALGFPDVEEGVIELSDELGLGVTLDENALVELAI